MAERPEEGIGIDQRLVRLASDAVSVKALIVLNDRVAGAKEIAEQLGEDVDLVSGRLDQMHRDGLISTTEESPGESGEPRYRPLVRTFWSDEEWSALGHEERRRMSAWIIRLIGSDAADALEAGSFDARPDTHASRTVMVVDERGWRELTRIQEDALEALFAVRAASAERLAESGQEGIPALAAMLCFEMGERPRDAT